MNNKTVQQRLCTEPKDTPDEALRFAVAFEEGNSQQRSFGGEAEKIKNEPICSINERTKNPCTRCGFELAQNHLSTCKAKDERCPICGGIGHFARLCKKPKTANFRRSARKTITGKMRRVNLIDQQNNQSEGSTKEEADNVIKNVNGDGAPPFVLKGKINNRLFCTMIDSGSPITICTQGDLRKILKLDVTFARPFPKSEEYVDFNGRPLNLLGYTTVDVKVGKKTIKSERVVIAREGKKSLIGRNWLAKLNSRVAESNKISEYNSSINNIDSKQNKTEKSVELKIKTKIPKNFH